jgi:beta-galactosidase
MNFRNRLAQLAFLLPAAFFPILRGDASPNAEIFHEQEAAKKFITFDKDNFIIHGLRVFLTSGSIHYTRVPRELWRDRLVRAKMAGFNTIMTYVSWNAHEPEEGQFDFSGNKDLSAFLDVCKEVRLCVIVRLGPYSCAEWDLGGFPAWLAIGKGVRLRTDDPEYLKYVDRWFEKLLPIVAGHQIHKGGRVIMVQLENEYKGGWGTDEDAYLAHLRKKALEMGIEVPMYYSGLHHSHDPAGGEPIARTGNSPWFSTEFWPGWYDRFGELPEEDIQKYERATWKVIAFGGAGYNYYMLHGGTNWGYTSNDEISTSYDFSAPIGESGVLRKSYFRFKKLAIFAATFGHITSHGEFDEEGFKVNSGELKHYLRSTPRGKILFLGNPDDKPITTRIEVEGHPAIPMVKPLTVLPREMHPLILDMTLTGSVTLFHCASKVLAMRRMGKRIFILLYGREGEPGEIVFKLRGSLRLISGITSYIIDARGQTLIVSFDFPGAWQKNDFAFECGATTIQVVALNDRLAERAWFDPFTAGSAIAVGPYYVREFAQEENSVSITAEFRGDEEACYIYTAQPMLPHPEKSTKLFSFEFDKANVCLTGKPTALPDPPAIPELTDWRSASAALEADPKFDDSGWLSSDDPRDMGAMPGAHKSFYGWYRCSFDSPASGEGKIEFPFAGDTIYVFVNGKLVGKADGKGPQSVSIPVQGGKNLLAVLARHSGRDKLYNFSGVAGLKVATGIHGPVKLTVGSESNVLKGWRYRAGLIGEEEGWYAPEKQSAVDWRPLADAERPPTATFYAARFSYKPRPDFSEILRLKTKGMSRGTLWLNGRIIGQYVPDGEYYLPEPWLNQDNLIVLADEEGKSPDRVTLLREAPAAAHRVRIELVPE